MALSVQLHVPSLGFQQLSYIKASMDFDALLVLMVYVTPSLLHVWLLQDEKLRQELPSMARFQSLPLAYT